MLIDGPQRAKATVILAHGAGAPMDTSFMNAFAEGLAGAGFRVVRFEFAYMAAQRKDGKRRGPDRADKLLDAWREVIAAEKPRQLVIGGKSMGGRIASMAADECEVLGVLCLGYPFHPPGKPDNLRIEHLQEMETPTLILQGERDSMGDRAEVESYDLAETVEVSWLPDGNHSFKPRKSSGHTEEENWSAGVQRAVEFVRSLLD